ncbi:AbrB/MazE/SpoVT family DNA-binding domain-containing protein [Neobacillus niacini]|uniref:AbrB/MazE/SpoVT family DNA-binding domain-containing protein n=1 Tax=Neobacillus niacini TaxID=86668 RepID=UPI0021CB62C9|nr:AbrB/MazE/SpoVT family DNA-binding domain-containing protein [Neobacillus niacini]MCM3767742.1 AbrB/MazE/SpoVT family DNA-binding domain-containing protein [Neobacillus niacini]
MDLMTGKMTSRGQVTIPKELRDRFNLSEGDQFRIFVNEKDEIKLELVKRRLLSDVVWPISAKEPIDFEKIRERAHEAAAKEIYSEMSDHDE